MAQSPVFLELKRIEAARNIAKIIGEGQNRVFLDSDTLMMNLT
jgi:prohibitin 2